MLGSACAAIEGDAVSIDFGYVESVTDLFYIVASKGGNMVRATKADSCLVKPGMGDKVLVCASASGEGYVLSILEAASAEGTEIDCGGDLLLRARGRVHILAEAISLEASDSISSLSPTLRLKAEVGEAHIFKFEFLGRFLNAGIERVKITSDAVESVFGVVRQTISRSYRVVEQLEQATLGRLRYLVEGSLFMKSKRASLSADEDIKIDADQVQLG